MDIIDPIHRYRKIDLTTAGERVENNQYKTVLEKRQYVKRNTRS